jgi:phosphoribosylamine--glycine ligase
MRILGIDNDKAEVDFYLRCMEDGHKVKVYIKPNSQYKDIGKGLLDIVTDWRDHIEWCDMVYLSDNSGNLAAFDKVRLVKPVLGPTVASAKWELDRQVGQDIFEKCGIDTIPSESFDQYDDAIKYVQTKKKRFVCKPCGGADKSLSYVSKTPEDMIFMLERWKKIYGAKTDIIVQEFIPGIEMAIGGWFGPEGFNVGWLENFEFKKLMNDDIGPNTGEMGTCMRYVQDSKLANEMLVPLVKELKKTRHTGYVDVAVIIDEKGKPWPLEFTMRPGYPTINIQQELHKGDCADWMLSLIDGQDEDNLIMDKVATGVIVAVPDFPYNNLKGLDVVGFPIYGLEQPLETCYHPCEVMKGKTDCLETAGSYVMVCTGTGNTIKQSSEKAYKALSNICIPGGMLYRTDIGARLKKQLAKLQKFGYATGLKYE